MMAATLKRLQVGQSVRIDERGPHYHVTILPAEQGGKKVAEVGHDYVVFEEVTEGIRTRMPFHIIDAVVTPAEVGNPAA
jgi:hypothetical protein